ncbi:MAG: glycosyltransferase family 87 protein [Pseudomonadota bacterium]
MAKSDAQPSAPSLLFPPRRETVALIIGVWGAVAVITALAMYAASFSAPGGVIIGGDFVAFAAASRAAMAGAAAAAYDPVQFEAMLRALYPNHEPFGLTWQYPPTYFLIAAPFAGLPVLAGFALWSFSTGASFALLMRRLIDDRLIWLAVLASPTAYVAFITGQNGFFTACLILLAAFNAKTRPLIAGLAAGLLTLKPHLGLLLPIAFVAGGCWRAIGVAAITSIGLALLSVIAFGVSPWIAFIDAVFGVSENIGAGIMPLAKMTTPFSAALFAMAAPVLAQGLALLCAFGAAIIIWRLWRHTDDPAMRAAGLCAGLFFATPYGFNYELIILAFPVAWIVMQAVRTGWLALERQLIAAAAVLPICITIAPQTQYGVSIGFIVVGIVFFLTMRRIAQRAPVVFEPFSLGLGGTR